MGVLVSKPGITSASTLSIPKDWSPSWFRNLIENQLKGADVRNAVGSGGISVSGNIASPYATIGFAAPVSIPGPVTVSGNSSSPIFVVSYTGNNDAVQIITNSSNPFSLRLTRSDIPSSISLWNNSGTFQFSAPISTSGIVAPALDNTYSCGESSFRWSVVYAATGTINTSDSRLKTDVRDSGFGLDFINSLRPVSYRWIEGGQKPSPPKGTDTDSVSIPGVRTHYGLLAQEVINSVQKLYPGVDFAGWVLADKSDPNSIQGLRYSEFIAPLIKAVQQLSAQVVELQSKIGEI